MITIRKAKDRGHADHGWLDTSHTFSFADYWDPRHMGWGPLRVLNEDRVAAGTGFPTHAHRDMEIITYVLEGALEHRDSLGTGSVIRPGEVQRMSAGTGVRHSEYNASKTDPVHFLQIWIEPARRGVAPGYEQKTFGEAERRGRLRIIAAPDGREGAVTIHQDATVYATTLARGERVTHAAAPGRLGWVQVARGALLLNGERLAQGDGAAIERERALTLEALEPAEALLFDLPAAT
jgi:redox-sensitive bicupin YhaK (pirin superfamily)